MQLQKVVVGTDFGESSLETAAWVASTLARDAEIVLVHAIDEELFAGAPTEATVHDVANDRMRDMVARLARSRIRTEVVVGRPHAVIATVAQREGADLMVVGAHANREHESRLLGTTADRVVRGATRAVLVGARTSEAHAARVVAAVDDSDPVRDVLAWCDYAARQLAARVSILHVLSDAAYSHVLSVASAHAHGDESARQREVNEELEYHQRRWMRDAEKAGIAPECLDVFVEHGAAAERILDVARSHDASLVIVGRHDGAPGAPTLLGRTVRHVLHGVSCHLLIVPGQAQR